MIGIDSNVLIRVLVMDDERQAATAQGFFSGLSASEQGYVSLVTIAEVFWVLTRGYHVERAVLAAVIEQLLETEELAFQDSPVMYTALLAYREGADFADALIEALARNAGCTKTVTFDRRAASALGMELLS
jgi:predicted nucleic-acid-binding protein